MIQLLHGDCIELMQTIPDGSVDMILCDLPYGTTACKWDTVIPFEPLWAQYRRVAKRNAAIVLTASQPFTTALIASNMREFRYCWVWEKNMASGPLLAKVQPMRAYEDVCVFYAAQPTYRPQGTRAVHKKNYRSTSDAFAGTAGTYVQTVAGYPRNVLHIDCETKNKTIHPTQKPVALMEYVIRTYTHEGETVMDNCMGSGTTGVACVNTGRNFIGIERDDKYFAIAEQRIADAGKQERLVA